MAETIYKVLDCEVKKLGERSYEFTASTSTIDRDGEVIEAKGWDLKNFKKNPVIMYAHDYRSLPIGKAPKVWLAGGKLKNTVQFPPEGTYEFADIVERLVDTGYLKTESVGFIPQKWEDGDGEKGPKRTYLKQELLEISIVPVPSNPDALRNAVDDGVITTKELKVLSTKSDVLSTKKGGIVENPDLAIIGDKLVTAIKEQQANLITKPEEAEEKVVTQAGVKDEFDYLKGLINDVGLNEEAKEEAWELVREIIRLAGDDIPDDIRDEIGVTITAEQELKVGDAIDYLTAYLMEAKVESDEPKVEPELDEAQIGEIIAKAVGEAIGKAQGKI